MNRVFLISVYNLKHKLIPSDMFFMWYSASKITRFTQQRVIKKGRRVIITVFPSLKKTNYIDYFFAVMLILLLPE